MGLGARALLSYFTAPLLFSGMAAPSWAETRFPIKGGDAEEPTVVDYCPAGHYVIGFTASTGQDGIDRIQIACGELRGNGTGPVAARGPERGGSTGTVAKSMCPAGTAVNRFYPILTRNRQQVRYVSFSCANPVTGRVPPDADGSLGIFGAGPDDEVVDKEDCPRGEFARGLTINYGNRINAMAMICERVPAAAPAAPYSAPASTTPSAPVPPPSPAPSPASSAIAPVQAFQGGWQTVTNQNGHYTLVLQIANPGQDPRFYDTHVTGQFFNTDGETQYNGVLQGTIPRGTRMLIYGYSQPETKTGGRGQFTLSQDGNAITGTGTAGDQTFTWNGTRAK